MTSLTDLNFTKSEKPKMAKTWAVDASKQADSRLKNEERMKKE